MLIERATILGFDGREKGLGLGLGLGLVGLGDSDSDLRPQPTGRLGHFKIVHVASALVHSSPYSLFLFLNLLFYHVSLFRGLVFILFKHACPFIPAYKIHHGRISQRVSRRYKTLKHVDRVDYELAHETGIAYSRHLCLTRQSQQSCSTSALILTCANLPTYAILLWLVT